MPHIDLVVESPAPKSLRARQTEALFDVPPGRPSRVEWHGDVPLEGRDWNVGLIVGPSGAGKTSVARQLFGADFHPELAWKGATVLDDVKKGVPIEAISAAFSAVGFNTIPAWLRPHAVLSNGERFRADVARRLLELRDPIVVDEFTSVVDRRVAQVGSHAIAKFVRKNGRRFVAVTCHYDVIDWLQPDWVLEPSTMKFTWRSLRRRPELAVDITRVDYSAWQLFAPFHYLTADLHKGAACYVLSVDGRPAAFAGVLHFPHATVRDIKRLSRLVTLPDWQGLGLAFVLTDKLAAAHKAAGLRFRTYPAHPSLVRSFQRSAHWRQVKEGGTFQSRSASSTLALGGRPCAVFEWCGDANKDDAKALGLII